MSPTVSPAEHIWICTVGMAEIDAAVLDAIRAARGSTQSPTEMVATIQWAQDRAEILATEAAGMTRLSAALQAYADALGAAGMDEVATAREEVDVACLMPN